MIVPRSPVLVLLSAIGLVAGAAAGDPSPLDPPAVLGAMAPQLSRGADGLLLSWLEPRAEGRWALRYAHLRDGAWSAPGTAVESDGMFANWADVPAVVDDPAGGLLAHWLEKLGDGTYAYGVALARQPEGGGWGRLGWLHDDRSETEHGFVSWAAEGDELRAVWLDGRATARPEGAMSVRSRRLRAGRLGPEELIDDRVCDCCPTALVATPGGPVAAFRDRSAEEQRDIRAVRRGGAEWQGGLLAEDGWRIPGCPVNGPALATSGDILVGAWYTVAAGTAKVQAAFSADHGASWSRPLLVDGEKPLGRVAIAGDGGGGAVVGWLGLAGDQAELLLRRVEADGSLGPLRAVARTGASRSSGVPRLAADGDGLLAVWVDDRGTATRLRGARLPWTLADASPASPAEERWSPEVGAPLPSLRAERLDGGEADLADLVGKPILVNLWATWCLPCRAEMPHLARLAERHVGRLTVVGISVDKATARSRVEGLVEKLGLGYLILLDPADRASELFRAPALPANFLFDADGRLLWHRFGAVAEDDPELAAALEVALPPPAARRPTDARR